MKTGKGQCLTTECKYTNTSLAMFKNVNEEQKEWKFFGYLVVCLHFQCFSILVKFMDKRYNLTLAVILYQPNITTL